MSRAVDAPSACEGGRGRWAYQSRCAGEGFQCIVYLPSPLSSDPCPLRYRRHDTYPPSHHLACPSRMPQAQPPLRLARDCANGLMEQCVRANTISAVNATLPHPSTHHLTRPSSAPQARPVVTQVHIAAANAAGHLRRTGGGGERGGLGCLGCARHLRRTGGRGGRGRKRGGLGCGGSEGV